MATCARCGRPTQTGTRICLACSIRPTRPGQPAYPAFARPYVQLAGAGGLLPVLASTAPQTAERRPAAPAARQAPPPAKPAGQADAPASPSLQAPADAPPGHQEAGAVTEAGAAQANPWLARPPRGRWIALTAATAVVVIAAAVATLVTEHHTGSPRAAGRTGPAAGARQHNSPGPAPSSRAARPLVAVAPGVTTARHAPGIVAFLTRYFSAIDHHNYRAYRNLFTPSSRSALSAAGFAAGYGTTRDTDAVLHRVSTTPQGQVAALVTFTSHQRPSDSPTRTACTAWSISLYLDRNGGSYVIATPPHGYQPTERACS